MYYTNNNITIYYKKYGNSPKSILILPGWGNNSNTFKDIINNLKNDYTIYIIDYPYFGNSPIPNKELTIYDYTNLIYNFIKHNNIINPILISHSFGGRITSILLSKYKLKINKLILIDVAGIKRFNLKVCIKQKIYKTLKLLIKLLPKNKQYKYHKLLLLKFSSNDYLNIPSIMKNTFKNIIKVNLKKHYKNINIDTLIVWGDKDIDTPLKDAKYLYKAIKNSTLIIYKNKDHFSYLNNKSIIKDITTFINKKSH